MAVLFTDDFNRADNDSLGSNWTDPGGGLGDIDILSNRARFVAINTAPLFVATAVAAHAATADVKVTVTHVATGSDGGPMVRNQSGSGGGAFTGYVCDVFGSVCEIQRHDASATGTLLRTASITMVANGVIALEAEGTAGTVSLKQYYNGVQQGATHDDSSGNRITTAGRSGIYAWNSGANGDYDDFLVETLAPPPVEAPRFAPFLR